MDIEQFKSVRDRYLRNQQRRHEAFFEAIRRLWPQGLDVTMTTWHLLLEGFDNTLSPDRLEAGLRRIVACAPSCLASHRIIT